MRARPTRSAAKSRARARATILLAGPHGRVAAAVYDRGGACGEGMRFDGPAIVEQADTTTLVEPGWHARVVAGGTLLIERP